jgi:hypothetical protein
MPKFLFFVIGFAAALGSIVRAQTTVTVSNAVLGTTPMYLGFSQGDYVSNTNTSAWVDYSNANAFRIWSSPGNYPAAVSSPPSITTQSQFDAEKAALRSDPTSSTYINWNTLDTDFAANEKVGSNQEVLNYALGQLNQRNILVIEEISYTDANEVTDWQGKWTEWQEFYAQAFYEAKNFNVAQFQIYNEPDDSSGETPADLLVRLQLASDAIHSAIADVDLMYGKNLVASVAGPTSAGSGSSTFNTWGKPLLAGNRTSYEGTPTNYDLFDTYDFHLYSANPSTFATNVQYVQTNVPLNNASGNSMPVIITEFNYETTATFASNGDSLTEPKIYAGIGADLIGATSANVEGMYAFKFSQTPYNSSSQGTIPQPTGFYYLDSGGTDNITGSTPAAEVYRLFTKAFQGARTRVSTSVAQTGSTFTMAADFDSSTSTYYAFATNTASSSNSFTLNLSGWNIPTGALVTVEQVSSRYDGEVANIFTVPSNGQLTITQPADSVDLLTIPQGTPQRQVSLTATATGQVQYNPSSSSSVTTNFFGASTSQVARSTASNGNNYATYLQFNLAGQNLPDVSRAILEVTGGNTANSNTSVIEVYGILNNTWDPKTLDWKNAPDLTSNAPLMTNVGSDAFPVGHLSFTSTQSTEMMDVTPFLDEFAGSEMSFVLVREQQYAGEANDGDVVSLVTDGSSLSPQLLLFTSSVPEPTVGLLGVAMGGLMLCGRRWKPRRRARR